MELIDLIDPRQGFRRQKISFWILAGIHCHNIPNCTPLNGHHGVIKVTKKDDIAKMIKNYLNRKSTRPTVLQINPPRLQKKWV